MWSGGEPTLYPKLRDHLHQSTALGNANVLVTNGSRFIPELPVAWVDFSIYGYLRESFQSFTGSSQFEKVRRNLSLYASTYPRVSGSIVLGVHGVDALKRMADMAIDAGVRRLKFHRLSLAGRNTHLLDGTTAHE